MERSASAPRIVGRYALYDVIATGGMASVHLGRLTGPVGFSRTVAIKRLHEQFARDPAFVAMFLDEARLVARIRHPNVVPTIDVVALQEELLIVMEYIAGESLFHLLKHARVSRTPPPLPIVVDVIVGVLHGLHAAHDATNERGEPLHIVHRDVSPQNILVGADGVARVLDFGVAKAAGRSQHTEEGQIKGKLQYMAPEQIRGDGSTRAADVYSASIVLWEALTGKPYHSAELAAEMMYRALHPQPTPPSRWRSDVSSALDDVVLRGLCPDAAHRYPTARAMADALQAVVTPAARGAVADWVGESAAAGIDARARRVAEVESDVTRVDTPFRQTARARALGLPEAAPSEPSSASLERPLASWVPDEPRPSRSRLAVVAVAALCAGGLAALFVGGGPRSLSHGEDARGAPAASAARSAAAAPDDSAAASPVAAAPSATAPPAVSVSLPASSSSAQPRAKPRSSPPKAASSTDLPSDRIFVRD